MSRLLWFFIGGATATYVMGHRRCGPGTSRRGWVPNETQMQGGSAAPGDGHAARWGTEQTLAHDQLTQLQALRGQVADSMAELSEATLDSLLSTAGALKAKLAEHRKERENEERQA